MKTSRSFTSTDRITSTDGRIVRWLVSEMVLRMLEALV